MSDFTLPLIEQIEVARLYITGEKTMEEIHTQLYPNVAIRTLYGYTENSDTVAKAVDTLHGAVAKACYEKGLSSGKTNSAYMKLLLENLMGKVATQKSEIAISGIGEVARQIVKGKQE